MKQLKEGQSNLIKWVIPFYDPTKSMDKKTLEILNRVLKSGKYSERDSEILNIIRNAYKCGIFKKDITENEQAKNIGNMIANLK